MTFDLLVQLWPAGLSLIGLVVWIVTIRADLTQARGDVNQLRMRLDTVEAALNGGREQFATTSVAIAEIRRDIQHIRDLLDRRRADVE